jgi:hypothetical protein
MYRYIYTIGAVIDHQKELESGLFLKQVEIEQRAVTLSQSHNSRLVYIFI